MNTDDINEQTQKALSDYFRVNGKQPTLALILLAHPNNEGGYVISAYGAPQGRPITEIIAILRGALTGLLLGQRDRGQTKGDPVP